jgi:branched-chain amino acid aminotransferase
MISTSFIKSERTQKPKIKPTGDLGFGIHFTDHVFVCDFIRKSGWGPAYILPYDKFHLDPSASVLHYGQALFEGMKAFRQINGDTVLFRPHFNYERMKSGTERLCMEMPSEEIFIEGIKALIKADLDWVPHTKGSSLYIRPTLIGTEAFLGVRPSDEYRFFVIASPVSSYYKEGSGPVKIWVEENYVRAAPGGLGATKAAANYAGSLKAAYEAKKKGFAQVLWLDVNHQYIEEVGTMNVFFVINGEVHTPSLNGTILDGGVRSCVIQLLKDSGLKVVERKIKWSELDEAFDKEQLTEAFGTGTAAVITPIGELTRGTKKISLDYGTDPFKISRALYSQMTAIQFGEIPDKHAWLVKI